MFEEEKALVVEEVTAGYNGNIVLKDISFEMLHPSILVIMGPNGAGKTTLLKTIIGLLRPYKGRIFVFGHNAWENLSKIRKLISYVPQRERVSESVPLRVRDIVLLGRMAKKGPLSIPSRVDIKATKEALKKALVPREFWDKKFSELSGGLQQKVLIARALVTEPKILLLDEPFSAVDAPSQREIIELLARLRSKGVSSVIVTHDINPLVEYTDYVLLLNRRVIAFGKPEEVLTGENLSKAYGISVKVLVHKGVCYAIIGDYHA
ncbi:MAG: metal ABC transporter ATP-binding protein [Candidatus Njordarchaeales archaeon]